MFVYVVSLVGEDVFHGWYIHCVITHIDDLNKVRTMIKEKYGIEFEERSVRSTSGWWKFDNITDNKDIKLIVERTNVLN